VPLKEEAAASSADGHALARIEAGADDVAGF